MQIFDQEKTEKYKYSFTNIQIFGQEERRRLRDLRAEREARSLAIEKAYVHDVYEQVKLLSFLHKTVCFRIEYRDMSMNR